MKTILFVLLTFVLWNDGVCSPARKNDATLLTNALKSYLSSGFTPKYLQNIVKHPNLGFNPFRSLYSQDVSCDLCNQGFETLQTMLERGVPDDLLRTMVIKVCVDMKFEDINVCENLLQPMLDVVFYIMHQQRNFTAEKLCSMLLESTCHNQFEYFNWTIDIPDKPSHIPQKIVQKDEKPFRILHLTDMHLDNRYTPGATALCGEPICCQDDQGIPENSTDGCGFWGDYRTSDIPRRTLDDMIRQAQTQEFDLVYFTGDIIPHRVWSTSRENNSKLEYEIMDLLRTKFGVPVLFVLGNHEAHPVNAYAPLNITTPTLSTQWLFDVLSSELKQFASEGDFTNVENGGFYSVVLKPGFRIIVLNNNICLTENLWLAYDDYDPYGQLQWLVKTLERSEEIGEYVHLVYHVPSGESECLGTWGREYNRIINRFSETIRAQFNGHTHYDEFFLYFNESNSFEAVSVAFNGASLTTYTDNNPSYKIYEVDAQNFNVIDFEEWTFNLTSANLSPEKETLDWYKLYSFKDAYGLTSMEPEKIGEMVLQMAKTKYNLQRYNQYKYRLGDGADMECDDDCHKANLCNIVTSSLDDTYHCEAISNIYDGTI